MSELERLIQRDHIFTFFNLLQVSFLVGVTELPTPLGFHCFEFIPTITEIPNGIDVKRVLTHAYSIMPGFFSSRVDFFEVSLTELLYSLFEFLLVNLGLLLVH